MVLAKVKQVFVLHLSLSACIFSPIWGVIASAVNSEKRFLLISPIFGFFIVTYLLFYNQNIIVTYILCVLFGSVQAVHVLTILH